MKVITSLWSSWAPESPLRWKGVTSVVALCSDAAEAVSMTGAEDIASDGVAGVLVEAKSEKRKRSIIASAC